MVSTKGQDIAMTLQLLKSDYEPDENATVTYKIIDKDLTEVVSSQTATYSSTTESYIDNLDVSVDWTTQDIGSYYILWAVTDTNYFSSLYTEDLQIVLNETDVKKILGLVHHNIYMDEPLYDVHDNLISLRSRIYSDSASVGTDNNVISTYTVTSDGSDIGKFTYWQQVED